MTPAEIDAYRRVPETCTAVDNAFFRAFGDVAGSYLENGVNAARADVKLETGRLRVALIKACGEIAHLQAQSAKNYGELVALVNERDALKARIGDLEGRA